MLQSHHTLSWQSAGLAGPLVSALRCLGTAYPAIVEGPPHQDTLSLAFQHEPGMHGSHTVRNATTATITYSHLSLALRAISSLLGGRPEPGQDLTEQHTLDTLGVMLDCSRNAVMLPEHITSWLCSLALLGYNMLMLYTEDTYELDDEPYFGYQRGAYTHQELADLDRFAARLGITLIPCIQTLGHLEQILRWPAYAQVKDTSSVLLVDQEATYALIGKMLDRCASAFSSRRIHIGMDETHDLGRGRFMDLYGPEKGFDIFNRHLARVTTMCLERGLDPMIWSDMYFRLGSKTMDYYDPGCEIPPDVARAIPAGVQLVYWDYYHPDGAFYNDWIARHRALGHEPLVASGVWTWGRLWYDRWLTEANATPCIAACREQDVRELIFTLWGDDGGYCDMDSALVGLAYAAEIACAPSKSSVLPLLERRVQAVLNIAYDTVLDVSSINKLLDPAAILWDDPLLNTYAAHLMASDPSILPAAAQALGDLATRLPDQVAGSSRGGDLAHAHCICRAASGKAALAHAVLHAYGSNDLPAIEAAAAQIAPLREDARRLAASFRRIWLARNKPQGLEVLQIRLAGLDARLQELETRLTDYAQGRIAAIPELAGNTPSAPHGGVGRTSYHYLASGSLIL